MRDAFGVERFSKRMLLGRDMSTEGHKDRMKAMEAESDKIAWKRSPRPVHVKQNKDFDRWLKEVQVHAADPVRLKRMQYAAKHGLDYPLKRNPKAKSKAKPKTKVKQPVGKGLKIPKLKLARKPYVPNRWPTKMSDIPKGHGSALKMISNSNRAMGRTGEGWVIPEG